MPRYKMITDPPAAPLRMADIEMPFGEHQHDGGKSFVDSLLPPMSLSDALDRIEQLETALMHLDDDLAAERGLSPVETADFTIYRGKHAGVVVTVRRPKEPA
jgi:hypothetical protein